METKRSGGRLAIVLVLLLVLGAFYLGRQSHNTFPTSSSAPEAIVEEGEIVSERNQSDAPQPVAATVPEEGFRVDIRTLPEAQQGILRTLGYETSITFTPEMVACAEGKIGTERVAEIKVGGAPGPLEVASLIPCF